MLIQGFSSDPELRANQAAESLVDWANHNKGIVLLIDNFQMILDRLSSQEHHRLRKRLSMEKRLVLIGASPNVISATIEYDAAFYDFFAPHELRGMDFVDAQALMMALAKFHGATQVENVVTAKKPRFRALHTLTGGNPRTLVLLYHILTHDDVLEVHVALQRLLDMTTPLYKARVEELSEQEQRVLDVLALAGEALSAREVAERSHLEINNASARLARLVTVGVLNRVEIPGENRLHFEVSEPFFSIWYRMRAPRRVRRRLEWLIDFLEIFYGGIEELNRRTLDLIDHPSFNQDQSELSLALSQRLPDTAARRALQSRALEGLICADGFRERISEILDLSEENNSILNRADYMKKMAELKTRMLQQKDILKKADVSDEEFILFLCGSFSLSVDEKYKKKQH